MQNDAISDESERLEAWYQELTQLIADASDPEYAEQLSLTRATLLLRMEKKQRAIFEFRKLAFAKGQPNGARMIAAEFLHVLLMEQAPNERGTQQAALQRMTFAFQLLMSATSREEQVEWLFRWACAVADKGSATVLESLLQEVGRVVSEVEQSIKREPDPVLSQKFEEARGLCGL